MSEPEKKPEPNPIASVVSDLGCTIIIVVALLLGAAAYGIGPWAHP